MTTDPPTPIRRFTLPPGPNVIPERQVRDVMLAVILALIPGALVQAWWFGPGVLVQCVLAVLFALIGESVALTLRGRPALPTLKDLSATVTAILLAISIPGLAPWWVISLGSLLAILMGKQVYGGLGCNPFNPAMVGYAVLLISFPREMTLWHSGPIGVGETLQAIFGGLDSHRLDALAMATPLDATRAQVVAGHPAALPESLSSARTGAAMMNIGYLAGGLWLLRRNLIDARIPGGLLAGLAGCAFLFYVSDSTIYPNPLFHLFSGATMVAAFFIATDPVSAATTPRGRWIYGAGIGVLIYVIRTWGGYPDGVAFAVLLMNLAAPTLDHFTRPRVYGHPR
jgi:electron transport complex protein RnfD